MLRKKFILPVLLLTLTSHSADAGLLLDKIKIGLDLADDVVSVGKGIVEHINNEKVTTHIKFDGNKVYESVVATGHSKRELSKEYWLLGYEHQKKGKHIEAVKHFRKSIQLNAEAPKAWHAYGWSLGELGLYDQASNAFIMSLVLNNNKSDESWRHLGWNYHRNGNFDKAKECYLESLFINPKNKKSKYALGVLSKITKSQPLFKRNYTVQVGAFVTAANAYEKLDEVIKSHTSARVLKIKNYYCIVIGEFSSKKDAISYLNNSTSSKSSYVRKL